MRYRYFFFFAYRFLTIFRIRRYMTQCTFIDICRFMAISKSLRVLKFWHKMAYFAQIMLCAKIYITNKFFLFVNLQQIKLFLINQLCLHLKKKYMVSKVFRHFWFDRFSRNTLRKRKYALPIIFFLRIAIPEDFPNKTVYDTMHFYRHLSLHDIFKKLACSEILT